jgi:hypothetical protein
MKPEYANIFIVSSNSSRKEVVLTFYYEYPEFNDVGFTRLSPEESNLNVNKMQRLFVSSIVLTAEAAHHLGLTLLKGAQDQPQRPGMPNN